MRKSQAKNKIVPVFPSLNTQIQHWITAIFQTIKGLIINKRLKKTNKQQQKLQPKLHDTISVLKTTTDKKQIQELFC